MEKLIAFGILSIPVIGLSWRSLANTRTHGFPRFFAWECIVWLLVSNFRYWYNDPLSIGQLLSWAFLIYASYLVIFGVILIKRKGKPHPDRDDKTLFGFEKTTELVDTGIYKYIRHPLYASLIFLTWGIFLKNMTLELLVISLLSTVLLYFTSRRDEQECIRYFGDKYRDYMHHTKMFVPFIV